MKNTCRSFYRFALTFALNEWQPHFKFNIMNQLLIGTGKSNITDRRKGLQLQGMADPEQRSTDVLHDLFARAFYFEQGAEKFAIVIADIWSCTRLLKENVLVALEDNQITDLRKENLLIAGTHTHSAPGGFAGYSLFEQPVGKIDPTTLALLTQGITDAIASAIEHKKAGKIFFAKGNLPNCGYQRSMAAYLNNPESERLHYASPTDTDMLLLKFVQLENGTEKLIGCLNWYAIHPTDLGQFNTRISGDNKGLASQKTEAAAQTRFSAPDFVAAFANSNAGDVSGNQVFTVKDDQAYDQQLEKNASLQYQKAIEILEQADQEIHSEFHSAYAEVDFSDLYIESKQERTYPYALGLSSAAGSSEDSIPRYLDPLSQKVKTVDPIIKEGLTLTDLSQLGIWTQYMLISTLMALKFGTKLPQFLGESLKKGHQPKPIIFAPMKKSRIVPHRLPLQLLRVGPLVIAAIPGEITTMAGRRLRHQIQSAYAKKSIAVQEVAITSYANDYAQYITTKEEYEKQHYEGASTPFGPYTLDAYLQEFERLIRTA